MFALIHHFPSNDAIKDMFAITVYSYNFLKVH